MTMSVKYGRLLAVLITFHFFFHEFLVDSFNKSAFNNQDSYEHG